MPEPSRARRWLSRRSVLIAAGVLIALGAVLLTGRPQQAIAEWAIARGTGMIADVKWGGLLPSLRIDEINLYADENSYDRKDPLVFVTDLRVEYGAIFGARKINRVWTGIVLIDADPADPALRNLKILQRDPDAPVNYAYVPKAVEIENLVVRLHNDAMFFLFDGVSLNADLTDPDAPMATLSNRGAQIVYQTHDSDVRIDGVVVDGRGGLDDDGNLTWSQRLERPGVFRLIADARGPVSGDSPHIDVTLQEAKLAGEDVGQVLDAAHAPIVFSEFGLDSGQAHVSWEDPDKIAFNFSAAARVYTPRLPRATEPLYPDAIQLNVKAEQADAFRADMQLAFARGQRATATITGTADVGTAMAQLDGWSREQFLDAVPPAMREGLAGLSFDTFTSSAQVKWDPENYDIDGAAESHGGGKDAAPISWAVKAHGSRTGAQAIVGEAHAKLGDRYIRASAQYESDDRYVAEAKIEQVRIGPWVSLLYGEDMAARFYGTIEGGIRAEAKGKGAPLEIVPAITLKDFAFDTLKLDEITTGGAVQYDRAGGRVSIADLHVDAPDGMTTASLSGWAYDTKTQQGSGAYAFTANLGIVARLISAPDLYGSGTIEGKADIDGPKVTSEFTLASRDFNYGDFQMPYGTKLNGGGALEFDRKTQRGDLRGLNATIGDGTKLTTGAFTFTSDPVTADGDAHLTSDFALLAGMMWVDSKSDGALSGDATFHLADGKFRADWKAGMNAARIVLPEDAATAEGVTFEATGGYDDGLSGTGTVRAAKLMVAGGSVLNAEGPVLFDGELMRIQQAKGELFRGLVRADVDVGILRERMPISLNGNFDSVDLAIMTDEVKPPKTQLTGTARGSVTIGYDSKGLRDFTFEAQAPDGLSVNRSLVEELLQSDTFLSGAGANVAEKAMDKLLGSAPQRPFDRGSMNIGLADEKITGLAVLESQKTKEYNGLNLRVTLDMDQSTLAETLKMLQEASTATIDR